MKKLLQYILLFGVIGFSGYAIYYYSLDPCDKPLKYALGRFDPQFGVSKEEFKTQLASAEKVWEKVLGRDIFSYDPNARFKINLIYDERQLTTIQKQKTEFGLSRVEENFEKIDADFTLFKNQYESKVAVYDQALADFNQRRSAYDRAVEFWNKKGGASKDKYEELEAERVYLNNEAQKINAEAMAINVMSKELNILLEKRNVEAKKYNQIADAYNQKYGSGLEFNQAEYIGNPFQKTGEINVYQFGDKIDLNLALAHEFGHALGMDHVENPKSIMYYLTEANATVSLTPSAEDLAQLKRVCK